jgi:membrane-bound lytic murein transglycosylase
MKDAGNSVPVEFIIREPGADPDDDHVQNEEREAEQAFNRWKSRHEGELGGKSSQIQAIDAACKKTDRQNRVPVQGGTEPVIQLDKTLQPNPLFNAAKLYPGEGGENRYQKKRQHCGIHSLKIRLIRWVICRIDQKDYDKINEVCEHNQPF